MKNLQSSEIERYRDCAGGRSAFGWEGDETCGAFRVPCPATGALLLVIASAGSAWDHVSVSLAQRCPNWPEMEFIKRLFFRDDETAMQLHVPPSDHISFAPTALHLWRPQNAAIPRPPAKLVGAPAGPTSNAPADAQSLDSPK